MVRSVGKGGKDRMEGNPIYNEGVFQFRRSSFELKLMESGQVEEGKKNEVEEK